MNRPACEPGSLVVVIDDEADVREALKGLFRSVGLAVELFGTTHAYLQERRRISPNCLVLDVRLPGKSGLEFQDELNALGSSVPIVFISGHADVAMGVRAMKSGAAEFLTKPVRDQDLLDAVQAAIMRGGSLRSGEEEATQAKADYNKLTAREQDVLGHLAAGRRNKQIAADLGISEATVKLHRSNMMRKLNARSIVDLVRLMDMYGKGRT